MGAFASSSNTVHGSLDPRDSAVSISNCILIGSVIFAELMAVPILYNGPPLFHLKIALTIVESWLPSKSWFLGSMRVHIPNDISIGSAVFAGLVVIKTDRQTDCAFLSVAITNAAIWHNNNDSRIVLTEQSVCHQSVSYWHACTLLAWTLLPINICLETVHHAFSPVFSVFLTAVLLMS